MSEYYINTCPRCNFEHGWQNKPAEGGSEEFVCDRCGADVIMKYSAGAFAVHNGGEGINAGVIPHDKGVSFIQDFINENSEANVPAYMTLWVDATKEVIFLLGNESTIFSIFEARENTSMPEIQ